MEKNNDERNENIKAKLINNITITHLPESRIDLLSKINYLDFRKSEYENKQVKILNFNSNISFFDFFQDIVISAVHLGLPFFGNFIKRDISRKCDIHRKSKG